MSVNNFMHSWNLGWECPKCGRVYAPTQMMCVHCGGDQLTTTSDQTEPDQQEWVGHGSSGDPPPMFPGSDCKSDGSSNS